MNGTKGTDSFRIYRAMPPMVIVLDNKESNHPRLAVLQDGTATPILAGDSGVLQAMDLESLSVVDKRKGTYLAATSLGKTFVFRVSRNGGNFAAVSVSQGQLPVPESESVSSWRDPNRANIEAVHYVQSTGTCLWAARGGAGYAGDDKMCDGVWLRSADFDPKSASICPSSLKERRIPNLGLTRNWRAVSSLYLVENRLWLTAAYDGEEDGHDLDLKDLTRRTESNRKAFESLVAFIDLETGDSQIVARFEGMKIEAMVVEPVSEKLTRVFVASDDEGLGSLVGEIRVEESEGSFRIQDPVPFSDIADCSLAYGVERKRWGTSGMAPLHLG